MLVKLSDLITTIPDKKYQIKNSEILNKGLFPVVDQTSLFSGFSNDSNKCFTNGDCILFCDHTSRIFYSNSTFVIGCDGIKIIKIKDTLPINQKFIYYSLCNNYKGDGKYRRHFGDFKETHLLLPIIEKQNKIANILSNIDNQIERNNAMTKRLQVMGNTIYSKEINKDTKYFDLKTVANISTGKEDANFASPNGKYNFYTCSEEISKCNKYAFDGNSILIAGNGNFNVKYYNGKFNAYQRTYVIQNDTLFGNIYYSSLKSIDGFTKNANGSIIKFITLGLVQDIQIPIFTDKVNIILNNIVSKRNNIILETERLIALKEKLLPLLINGQLNI